MKETKITVIIPVHNTKPALLKVCLESCLNQTFKDLNILLVNDNSTKKETIDFLHLCDESNIKVIENEGKGVSNARMTGVKNAKTEYITLLDSDDKLAPEFCKRTYELINNGEYDVVCVNSFEINDINKTLQDNSEEKIDIYNDTKYINGGVIGINKNAPKLYTLWGKLLKRDIYLKCKIYDIQRGEDMVTMFDYICNSRNMITTSCYLHYYNANNSGSVTKQHDVRQMSIAKSYDEIYKLCLSNGYDDFLEKAAVNACNSIIGSIANAGRIGGVKYIDDYASILKKYRPYYKKLGKVNKIKSYVIDYFVFVYKVIGYVRSRTKKQYIQ